MTDTEKLAALKEGMKKFLVAYLKESAGMDETEVASLIKEDGLDDAALPTVLTKHQVRMAEIKSEAEAEVTAASDAGYKRAQKELMPKFEKELKEKFGIKSDKKGIALVDEIITSKATGTSTSMTDEEIKKTKVYLDLMDQMDTDVKAKQKELDDYKAMRELQEKTSSLLSEVQKEALQIFDDLQPVLSQNPEVAANQKKMFVEKIIASKYEAAGEGSARKITLLDDQGKPKTNPHGRRIDFKEFVTDTIKSFYDVPVNGARTSPQPGQNGTSPAGGAGSGSSGKAYAALSITAAKTKDEYINGIETIRKSTLSEEDKRKSQVDYMTDWEASQTPAGK